MKSVPGSFGTSTLNPYTLYDDINKLSHRGRKYFKKKCFISSSIWNSYSLLQTFQNFLLMDIWIFHSVPTFLLQNTISIKRGKTPCHFFNSLGSHDWVTWSGSMHRNEMRVNSEHTENHHLFCTLNGNY